VLKDLGIDIDKISLYLVEESQLDKSIELFDYILQSNQQAPLLQAVQSQAQEDDELKFTLEDGLLLYRGQLVVPEARLQTELICEAYNQILSAHPGQDKTYQLLQPCYYWKGMQQDVERFVHNCQICRQAYVSRDKTPGLLHPLPVLEYPWQHVTMDFKSMSLDKAGYDKVYIVIDRLSKQAISMPCYKTITAEEIAQLYIKHVYRYYSLSESAVSDQGPQFISHF
jgi:hypothetical protein